MRVFRWIVFIPAFVAYVVLGQFLCESVINWVYDWVFPLDDFWDFVFKTPLLSSLVVPVYLFLIGILKTIQIAPNSKIGSRILFVVTVVIYCFAYWKNIGDAPVLRMFLDSLVIICLMTGSFKGIEYWRYLLPLPPVLNQLNKICTFLFWRIW